MHKHVSILKVDFNLTKLLFPQQFNAHTIVLKIKVSYFKKMQNFRVLHAIIHFGQIEFIGAKTSTFVIALLDNMEAFKSYCI
jgi:hypothetical protein